ncbi:MAG: DUF1573 domain-containing protein [Bacteroidetes bacterium]|nr:MAG: DUF1573 domain-containing protein [Bacteroidota bacterium]
MNKIKQSLMIVILVFAGINLMAQGPRIKFEKTTHDFGTIKEEVRNAVAKFVFTNTGQADLKILKVKTSCGCTASSYSRGVIKPGEKGYVTATYHTAHRPGPFRKTITVTVNDPDHPNTVLFIKGKVTPRQKSPGDLFPTSMGNLKLMSNHLAFNDIKLTEVRTDSMKVYNNWSHPMTFSFPNLPAHLKVKMLPSNTLQPKTIGYIVVTYDANKKNDFGLAYDRVTLQTNDANQAMKTLTVSAILSQDFSNMTEKQLKKAPKIVVNQTTYDFGKVKSGTLIKFNFVVTNAGKHELIIHKVKASCGCTATKPAATHIKKNKSTEIAVEFNTAGRRGRQHKTITVITNDPVNPQIILNVQGELTP